MSWAYQKRFVTVLGNRRYSEVAGELSKLANRSISSTQVRAWALKGSTPRVNAIIEKWIREREPLKPQAVPRPHIGFSFQIFLDTTTPDEAQRVATMLEGFVAVIRARGPLNERTASTQSDGAVAGQDGEARTDSSREKGIQ